MAIQIKAAHVLKSLAGLALGASISTAIAAPFTGLVSEVEDLEMTAPYVTVVITGAIIVTLLAIPFGLAGHAILYALKRRDIVSYTAAGGLAGMASTFALTTDFTRIQTFILYSLWAAGCALIAWLIRRPDKDAVVPLDTHF
jgi:hypothetical protein